MNTDSHSANNNVPMEEFELPILDDPVVTIDRKAIVHGTFIASVVLSLVVLASVCTILGGRAFRNFDSFMILFCGIAISLVCAAASLWIRARWITVAVLDDYGIIASTMERKYDLPWSEVVGARTYKKYDKNKRQNQFRILVLLDDARCLEAPVDSSQGTELVRLMNSAEFKKGSEGQRLGAFKAIAAITFGAMAMALGMWWFGHGVKQFNNGVLFQGNAKTIVLKLAAMIGLPIVGLGSIVWGLYHCVTSPILYKPGYIGSNGNSISL